MIGGKCLNDAIRRKSKALDEHGAEEILRKGEWGTLAVIDENGAPYAVPVNFVWDGGGAVYIHGALKGRKMDCIRSNPRACFSIVHGARLKPGKVTLTEEYSSVTLRCTAEEVTDEEGKLKALMALIGKYLPELLHESPEALDALPDCMKSREAYLVRGADYVKKAAAGTAVVRLSIDSWSAKHGS
jgi:nitroimidazol reductase NimA-like FMN-containing flavoprotein (pyridoxamine 5'-phosphate oxidase superfamily)